MTSIPISLNQQKKLTPSMGTSLPVMVWQNIIDYLAKNDQSALALISRRLGILILRKPSPDLEILQQRKIRLLSTPSSKSEYCPTFQFLFTHTDNAELQRSIQSIKKEMCNDPELDDTVLDICANEKLHPGYIPLYHAINTSTFMLTFFRRAFLSLIYPSESLCNTPLIRFPSSNSPRTVEEHFKKFPVNNRSDYDWDSGVKLALLSCNPHLFANLEKPGECTWHFYRTGLSMNPPSPQEFFETLCSEYHLPSSQEQKNQFLRLYAKLSYLMFETLYLSGSLNNRGMILQILIPSAIIDTIAYASLTCGIPCSSKKTLSKRCAELCKSPHLNNEDQVRVLAQSLFEDNRIKIITHGCALFSDKSVKNKSWTDFILTKKNEIFVESQKLFAQMLL